MANLLGIPARRLPVAIAMVVALALLLSWLQGRFEQSDVKKAIALALAYRPSPGSPTVFDALVALGQGDPRCDGRLLSNLLGDVEVRCSTPGKPGVEYDFRVLLDQNRPPRAASPDAERVLAGMGERK